MDQKRFESLFSQPKPVINFGLDLDSELRKKERQRRRSNAPRQMYFPPGSVPPGWKMMPNGWYSEC